MTASISVPLQVLREVGTFPSGCLLHFAAFRVDSRTAAHAQSGAGHGVKRNKRASFVAALGRSNRRWGWGLITAIIVLQKRVPQGVAVILPGRVSCRTAARQRRNHSILRPAHLPGIIRAPSNGRGMCPPPVSVARPGGYLFVSPQRGYEP